MVQLHTLGKSPTGEVIVVFDHKSHHTINGSHMKKTLNSPLKLYFSNNLDDLDRRQMLTQFLKKEKLLFEEVSKLGNATVPPSGISKKEIRQDMEKADYYIVVADRYEAYQQWIALELICAFFLDVPIIVLQPWTCWSVPQKLKEEATIIINMDQQALVSFLQRPATEKRWLSAS